MAADGLGMEHNEKSNTALLGSLAKFTHLTTSYKKVQGHEIEVHILVPKEVSTSTSVPVIGRFHGGGLVCGSALFLDWLSPWYLNWALAHSAIVVNPHYRLLPESNGADILSDLHDFWQWVAHDLETYINQTRADQAITLDLHRTIALGESAGGYMAVQSGFLEHAFEPKLTIRAVIGAYPMIDLEDPWFTKPGDPPSEKVLGFPDMPVSTITSHLSSMRNPDGSVTPVSGSMDFSRLTLMVAAGRYGYYTQFLQGDSPSIPTECYPFRRLESATRYPPLLILHGLQDTAVPCEMSTRFQEALERNVDGAQVRVELKEGGHGFDGDVKLEEPWLADAVKWVEERAGWR